MDWKLLESEYLYRVEPWLTLRRDKCETPNGTIVDPYFVLEYPDWVNALAITADGKAILVRQYRHALGKTLLEIPGGVMDKTDAGPEIAVKRELLEETGYAFPEVYHLGAVSHNPSTSTNLTHMFLAVGGEKVQEQELDENEEIELMLTDVEEVEKLLRDNRFMQSLHVSCIFFALQKYRSLQTLS